MAENVGETVVTAVFDAAATTAGRVFAFLLACWVGVGLMLLTAGPATVEHPWLEVNVPVLGVPMVWLWAILAGLGQYWGFLSYLILFFAGRGAGVDQHSSAARVAGNRRGASCGNSAPVARAGDRHQLGLGCGDGGVDRRDVRRRSGVVISFSSRCRNLARRARTELSSRFICAELRTGETPVRPNKGCEIISQHDRWNALPPLSRKRL